MQTIWREFGDNAHSIMPLFETELQPADVAMPI